MPVTKMSDVSTLSDPNETTAPLLKGISGRKKSTKPLTEKSYHFLKEKLLKQEQQFKQSNLSKGSKPKLGFMLERATIPRAIGLKMTDLTESYNQQMWNLIEAAFSIETDEDEPFGPELEGVFEKSRAMAQRFQQAMEEIERCYALLREESQKDVIKAAKTIVSMNNTDVQTKVELLKCVIRSLQGKLPV